MREPEVQLLQILQAPYSTLRPSDLFARLERCGLSVIEAGNLTARLEGLDPVPGGWALAEIEQVLFLRWLVEHERVRD